MKSSVCVRQWPWRVATGAAFRCACLGPLCKLADLELGDNGTSPRLSLASEAAGEAAGQVPPDALSTGPQALRRPDLGANGLYSPCARHTIKPQFRLLSDIRSRRERPVGRESQPGNTVWRDPAGDQIFAAHNHISSISTTTQ